MKALDVSAHVANIHIPLGNDDAVSARNSNHDALFVGVDVDRLIVFRLVDIDAYFFDEGGRHDEENQHDKNHVQHGREVNLLIWNFFRCVAEWPSHDSPEPFLMRALV